jgi:hypothetical protein
MTHERDQRWAYIALGVLACAYVIYRLYTSEGGALPTVDLSGVKLGELGKAMPYVVAPFIAVLTEYFRRRRAREARRQWEARVRTEGFVRDEENVEVGIVEGGRGAFTADVRLTRAALYMFDRSGRRDPVRFVLGSPGRSETAVVDARLVRGKGEGRPRVRVATSGPAGLTFEFTSAAAEAWWSDIRRSLGKSTSVDGGGESAEGESDGEIEGT